MDEGLLELSKRGALIYVTLADIQEYGLRDNQGGFAFLLHQGQFQTVELPNLQLDVWTVKWQKFTQAMSKVQQDKAAASRSLKSLLGWLYDVLSLPVFNALGWSAHQQGPRRRVWWITAGLLSGVPLHAAGWYDETSGVLVEGVPHIALSSYISTGRALLYSQQAMKEYHTHAAAFETKPKPLKALLVSMSQTPGEVDLLHSQQEVNSVRNILAGGGSFSFGRRVHPCGERVSDCRVCARRGDLLVGVG